MDPAQNVPLGIGVTMPPAAAQFGSRTGTPGGSLAKEGFCGGGVCQDFLLANMYAHQRTLRLADGPDEVHNRTIAKLEARKHTNMDAEVHPERTSAAGGYGGGRG